jgi:hypothetical protein
MSTGTRRLSELTTSIVAAVLLTLGGLLFAWAQHPGGRDYQDAMSASFVSAIVRVHNSDSAGDVWSVSEMTREELGAAFEALQDKDRAVCRAEVERVYLTALALPAGVCCWLLGILTLMFRNEHSRRATARKPIDGKAERVPSASRRQIRYA